jgi:hypothetical protein
MNKIDEIINGMTTSDLPSDYWITSNIEFPELENSRSIIQQNGQSVWEHTMLVIDLIEPKTPVTLLSGLFHDLGKCKVFMIDDNSKSRFPGHAEESTNIAKVKLAEWKTSANLTDKIMRLVRTHMYDVSIDMKEKTIRKFVAEVGPVNIKDWFALRIADSQSYTRYQRHYNHFIKPFRKAVTSYLKQQPNSDQPEYDCQDSTGSIHIEGGINS